MTFCESHPPQIYLLYHAVPSLPLSCTSSFIAFSVQALVMHTFSCLLAVAAAMILSVSASPLHPHLDYVVKESHNVPPQWSNIGAPDPWHPLTLNIGLQPSDFDSLERHLHESEPSLCNLKIA